MISRPNEGRQDHSHGEGLRAKAGARYDNFVAVLGRRLNQGPKLRQEISEDVKGVNHDD
jgi:hypothetical protein